MTVLVLSPHHDDAVIFASYSVLSHDAAVVTVLRGDIQVERGIPVTWQERAHEDHLALGELGVAYYEHWTHPESAPDWQKVYDDVRELDQRLAPKRVFAPAVEDAGHEQHSAVGKIAAEVFGSRLTPYLTYVRGFGKSRGGREVTPEPWMIPLKLRALACYESQMLYDETGTRDWFTGDLKEYLA